MGRQKICSFYFLKNFLIKKLIFIFFISAIFNSVFFISNIFAEEIIKEKNFTPITNDITEDTTWGKEGSPYVLENDIILYEGATLYIESGVVVKFNPYISPSFIIKGNIIAEGTKDVPIYFTSNSDDVGISTDDDNEYCDYEEFDEWGEPVGDSVCYSEDWIDPYSNDWEGLSFYNSTGSSFKNVSFRYAREALYLEESDVNIENISISHGYSGLTANKNSRVKIEGGIFEDLNEAVVGYDESFLDINHVFIREVENGLVAFISSSYKSKHIDQSSFDNSILKINNLDMECKNDGVVIFNEYNFDIKNSKINCLHDGIVLFNEIKANIDSVEIFGSSDAGIVGFNNTKVDSVKVTNSNIYKNKYGFVIFNTNDFSANRNSIHDNFNKGVDAFRVLNPLDFTNNWWGDITGPNNELNPNGLGNEVSSNVLFDPWLFEEPIINKRNPVILIPGITGTYLLKDYDDKEEIWPNVLRMFTSISDDYLDELVLNTDGSENVDYPIDPGDIIRGISTVHVFDYLIDKLKQEGYIEGVDLFVFPYDWRLSTKNTAESLNEKINTILSNQEFSKVDIIAHSMGGLISKKYIKDYGSDKIDQLIFLGTPQLGSPKAFKVLMFGDDMSYGFGLLLGLNPQRVKYISQNMPSIYELLPSQKYLNLNGSYIENLFDKLNPKNLDYEETNNLMIEKGRNPLIYPFALSLHDSIDDLDLSSIKSYNFVGCGSPTIGKMKVSEEKSWLGKIFGSKEDLEIKYTDGDETVPLVSAEKTIGSEIYYTSGVSHGSLPASESVMKGILSILKDEGIVFDNVLKDDDTNCGIKGDVVSTHSPVDLHVYDEEGNHTGPDINGDIEYGIPGVVFDVFDDINYVFLPDGKNYKIITKATDTGGYNLKIEEQEDDESISKIHNWTLVPLDTINTTGEVWVGKDYKDDKYELMVDNEGDGVFENNYEEGFDGTFLAEELTLIKNNSRSSSGSYIKPNLYLSDIPIKKEVEQEKVKGSEFIAILNEKTTVQTIGDKDENIQDEKAVVSLEKPKGNLLASAGGFSFKNKSLLCFGFIIFGLIVGVLVKLTKKL
jgi:pimeloyl-ACP methyl ester carboxylesterase